MTEQERMYDSNKTVGMTIDSVTAQLHRLATQYGANSMVMFLGRSGVSVPATTIKLLRPYDCSGDVVSFSSLYREDFSHSMVLKPEVAITSYLGLQRTEVTADT